LRGFVGIAVHDVSLFKRSRIVQRHTVLKHFS
jgi:hypothetical protein